MQNISHIIQSYRCILCKLTHRAAARSLPGGEEALAAAGPLAALHQSLC